ncbi:MAG: MFS transporter [Rhizobiaceae bacterium]
MTIASVQSSAMTRYRVVFGACLTQFTIIGLLISYGLFFKVFETEFGWSRTAISATTSVAFFLMGVFAIAIGRLNDRYGPRLVLGISGTLYGIGYALMSQVTEIWHLFVLFGLCIGSGMAAHDVVTLSTVARWFPKKRGLMSGIVKTGTALGQVAVPPLAAVLLTQFGWQTALIVLGTVATGLMVVASACLADPPKTEASEREASLHGISSKQAARMPTMWLMCTIQFLVFPTLMTVPLHIVVHAIDLGSTPAVAALLLSTMGAASVVGRLSTGFAVDRIGGKSGIAMCLIPIIVSLAALMSISSVSLLFPIMAIYGFGHGGFFTVVNPTAASYFGVKALASIFGTIVFFGTLSGSIGPIVAGWIFDVTGSYFYAFALLCGGAVISLLLLLALPKPGPLAAQ